MQFKIQNQWCISEIFTQPFSLHKVLLVIFDSKITLDFAEIVEKKKNKKKIS